MPPKNRPQLATEETMRDAPAVSEKNLIRQAQIRRASINADLQVVNTNIQFYKHLKFLHAEERTDTFDKTLIDYTTSKTGGNLPSVVINHIHSFLRKPSACTTHLHAPSQAPPPIRHQQKSQH